MEENYFLRKVNENDINDIFQLSNEDYVRKFSINSNRINWDEHVIWFKNIMQSSNNIFYVVTDSSNKFLGQLRYKIDNRSAIVSISLCRQIMGKGLSSKFLKQSMKLISEEKKEIENIIAFVSDKNIVSKKLFEKVGFVFIENNNGLIKYIYSINKGLN